jgi:glutaredoxin
MATKSWLSKNNISYTEKNITEEENREDLIQRGYQSTPVTMIQNEGTITYIVGYNIKKLEQAFSI